ncbi:tapasin-related protein-like [Mobula birostris]|uniref:tapasin-related protein-like n=1 Tax=Mobula birostris TaxID=1983395 RepID=UPI003B2841B8
MDCWFLEEAKSRSAGLGVAFSRAKALLVLRNVSVSSESSPDPWSGFQIPEGDDELIIIEVDTSGLSIPEGDTWLHADCAGEQIECEVGALQGDGDGEPGAGCRYLASLQLPSSNLGMTLMLVGRGEAARVVPTAAEFLVYTRTSRIRTRLGSPVLVHCAQEGVGGPQLSADWWRQHEGSGRRLYSLSGGEGRPEGEGASVDADRARDEGLLSLRLDRVGVTEEGTYICAVMGEHGQAQQTSLIEVMGESNTPITGEFLPHNP